VVRSLVAVAAAALVPVLAGRARAEDAAPPPAAEDAPWFVGASVGYGKLTYQVSDVADGTTYTAEAGRSIAPWLAASLAVGLGIRYGLDVSNGPVAAAEHLDVTIGPRISVTPLRGRIRFGLGFGVLRHQSARSRIGTGNTELDHEIAIYSELHAGVVPLRRGAFELEVHAARGSTGGPTGEPFDDKTWYAVGVGLRWRGEGARSSSTDVEAPPRPSRPSMALSSGMFRMRTPDGIVWVPFVELALRYRAKRVLELELAIRHGRPQVVGQGSAGDTDATLAAEQATVALRRRFWTDRPTSWFAGGGIGLAMAAHSIGGLFPVADEELRTLVMAGVGIERRYRVVSFRAELGGTLMLPSSVSGGHEYEGFGKTVESIRHAGYLVLGGITVGAAYHF